MHPKVFRTLTHITTLHSRCHFIHTSSAPTSSFFHTLNQSCAQKSHPHPTQNVPSASTVSKTISASESPTITAATISSASNVFERCSSTIQTRRSSVPCVVPSGSPRIPQTGCGRIECKAVRKLFPLGT
jgi:hypothetical protein